MKVMTAERWTGDDDPRGWWLSEKLDGVRAVWDGKVLKTRHGRRLNVPEWFTDGLPCDVWLDGELWMGRGRFEDVKGLIRRKVADWSEVLFMVFDSPDNEVWEDRLEVMRGLDLPDHVQVVEQRICAGVDDLERMECGIVDGGGEGVMLRRAGSYYVGGRSQHLQKMKRWQDDEAEVLEIGKGVLICEWAGKVIKLASAGCDALVGDCVTFAYTGVHASGLPRHTQTIGVRDYE